MSTLNSPRLILSAATAAVALGLAVPAMAGDACTGGTCPTNGRQTTFIAADAASAEEMLAKFEAVEMPKFDPTKREDQAYIRLYMQGQKAAMEQKAEIATEFVQAHPGHDKAEQMVTAAVMPKLRGSDTIDEGRAQIAKMMEIEGLNPKAKQALQFLDVQARLNVREDGTIDAVLADIDKLAEQYPDDPRVAGLLYGAAQSAESEQKTALMQRLVDKYPDSRQAGMAKGALRQAEGVGKPFELTFTDAASGEEINVQEDLKGKVVVVDFWATWCGPCIAEMPTMKKIYAEYKDKGVEFIGVSLDQAEAEGGKKALLEYVKENDVQWPQYYQGKFWDGEFSKSWGINSIPALFVVDADGKLHSVEARGQLEKMIPELIAKRDGDKAETASGEVKE